MLAQRQVFWGQGAFLTPQHLHSQDAWQRHYALRLHRAAAPFSHGFFQLQIGEDALDSGVVELGRFALLTAAGDWIAGGSAGGSEPGNAWVPERTLTSLPVVGNDPISLYLMLARPAAVQGLATLRPAGDAPGNELPARHTLQSDNLLDPFDPQAPEAEVDFLVFQPRIVTSLDEDALGLLQNSEALKFAEIIPAGPGRFKLSPDYIPPCASLAGSSNLQRWTRALADLIVSRGFDFASAKRQRGIRSASTSAQEVMRVLMMQTFARYIPLLQEHVRLAHDTPWMLYQDLRRLVAEFSVFSEDINYFGEQRGRDDMPELPAYDHDDLRKCFRIAFDRAQALVKALTVGAEVGITLTYDGRFYRADLPPSLFESDKTRFYLAFESDKRGEELAQLLMRTGKIASLDEMPKLLQAALFGLKIELLPVPPEELPQKTPNTTYFLVDTRHQFWQLIKERRSLAIFADLPSDSTVIKLYPVGAQE